MRVPSPSELSKISLEESSVIEGILAEIIWMLRETYSAGKPVLFWVFNLAENGQSDRIVAEVIRQLKEAGWTKTERIQREFELGDKAINWFYRFTATKMNHSVQASPFGIHIEA